MMRSTSKRLFLGLALLLSGCAGDGPTGVTPWASSGTPTSDPSSGPPVLAIRVLTAGVEVDANGYTIGARHGSWSVAANDSLAISALPEGDYLISISEIASNCAIVDSVDLHSVRLSRGVTTAVQFDVLCQTVELPDTVAAPNPNAPLCYLNGTGCSDAELAAWESVEKSRIALEKMASQPAYDSLKVVWNAYLHDFPRGQSQFLICTPKNYTGKTKIIGPEGGELKVGKVKIKIPAGALTQRTVISGVVPASLLRDVEVSPHGLQFALEAELEIDYEECDQPEDFEYRVAYIDANRNVLEWTTSTNSRHGHKITAEIEHFSKYAVAY
jgi:hypothetical protein